jgi:hypothetical protein
MNSALTTSHVKRAAGSRSVNPVARLLLAPQALAAADYATIGKGTVYTTVEFEDHGQDFLRWDIEEATGLVFDSQPFQGGVWCGCLVNMKALAVGERLFYVRDNGRVMSIKYPLVSIVSGQVLE